MFNLPNMISLCRIPLAFIFLSDDSFYRTLALFLAMLSDVVDGFIARYYRQTSPFGAIIDPIADKFFVFFVLAVLIGENRLSVTEAATMFCRDLSLLLFGAYLMINGRWATYVFRSIWFGKITTTLQFVFILALIYGVAIPSNGFFCFILLGICALGELYFRSPQKAK